VGLYNKPTARWVIELFGLKICIPICWWAESINFFFSCPCLGRRFINSPLHTISPVFSPPDKIMLTWVPILFSSVEAHHYTWGKRGSGSSKTARSGSSGRAAFLVELKSFHKMFRKMTSASGAAWSNVLIAPPLKWKLQTAPVAAPGLKLQLFSSSTV
jgi:hypothetical protein